MNGDEIARAAVTQAEAAWRDGWAECKVRLTEDEAFCLTVDVEEDAWLDSDTRRLAAAPDTAPREVEGLIARLREAPRGQGHIYPVFGRKGEASHHVISYGNMMHEAADMLSALTGRDGERGS